MTGMEILAICVGVFYLLPWLALHSWVLYHRIVGTNPVGDDVMRALVVVAGVIPFANLYLAIVFFIAPLWYKFKYRNDPWKV